MKLSLTTLAKRQALLVVAGASLIAAQAGAAVVNTPSATNSDLLLAVRATGGQGDTVTLLVNIGSYFNYSPASQVPPNLASTFSGATPGSTFNLNIGNLGAELDRLYSTPGLSWSDRTDLYWGVVGTNNSDVPLVYASRERIGDTTSNPWPALTNEARGVTSSNVGGVIYGVNGYTGREANAFSNVSVDQPDADSPSSYNFQVNGPNDFGGTSGWSNIEGNIGNSLDLWRVGAGAFNAGYFSLSDTGVVSFTAVPEPSLSILAAVGGVFLVTSRRRQPRA